MCMCMAMWRGCVYVWMLLCMCVCLSLCMGACLYVSMYASQNVWLCVYVYVTAGPTHTFLRHDLCCMRGPGTTLVSCSSINTLLFTSGSWHLCCQNNKLQVHSIKQLWNIVQCLQADSSRSQLSYNNKFAGKVLIFPKWQFWVFQGIFMLFLRYAASLMEASRSS